MFTCVGVICEISSAASFFNSVVFPALSRPNKRIRNSLPVGERNLRNKP